MNIGLVLMLAELPDLGRAQHYTEIRAKAQWAEANGFDALWLYDHLLYRTPEEKTIGIWECWSMLSALAEATQRVQLGTLVCCNLFRNPAVLAKMAITVDEISAGRLILGLGAGWNTAEFEAFGIPHDHLGSRYDEAIQIIKPLLRHQAADFAGRFYQAKNCVITPAGPRPAGPPLLLAGFGPRLLRLVARQADIWNSGYVKSPEAMSKALDEMHAACAEGGRDPATLQSAAMIALGFPDLAELSDFMTDEGFMSGSVVELAQALRDFEALGVNYVQFHIAPYTQPALERLAEAIRIYRQ